MRQALLAAALLLLSGCTGGGNAADAGAPARDGADGPSAEPVAPGASVAAGSLAEGRGGLRGTVHSDAGVPLPDARASLVEPGAVAMTDAAGTFAFANVTPGAFRLRVELDGFAVHERRVTVAPGAVADAAVVLMPLATVGADDRAHVHDYWGAETQRTILDAEIDVTTLTNGATSTTGTPEGAFANNGILYANTYSPGIKYRVPFPGDAQPPALVYPGAGQLDVTFTWDDAPPHYPKLGFAYESANSTDTVVLEPHGTGQPWSIAVTPDMADDGHQPFSLWSLFIVPVNDARNAPDYRPTLVLDTVRVTVTVHKGTEAPAEPPHPRFWENGSRILLVDGAENARTSTPSPLNHRHLFGLPAGRIVPPGTKWLEIDVRWSYGDPLGETLPGPAQALWYNDARQHWDRFVQTWARAEGVLVAPGHMHFNLTLEPGAHDAYYQAKTLWRFAPRAVDQENPDGVVPDWYRTKTVSLTVHAVKDPEVGA